jgi:hypothetical protein
MKTFPPSLREAKRLQGIAEADSEQIIHKKEVHSQISGQKGFLAAL